MGTWSADTSVLKIQSSELTNTASRLSGLRDQIQSVGNLQDLEFSGKYQMQLSINELCSSVSTQSIRLKTFGERLADIVTLFEKNESAISGESTASGSVTVEEASSGASGSGNGGGGGSSWGNEEGSTSASNGNGGGESWSDAEEDISEDRVEEDRKQATGFAKSFLDWLSKLGLDEAGLGKGALSYLEKLYEFLMGDMKGLTGMEDWCNLGDKSIGLWTGLYDYLKNYYNEAGSTFSVFNQQNVAGLSIIGGFLGLTGSIFGAVDTISNTENMGTAGVIGQILGLGDDAVTIWEGVEKLKHVGDAATNITTSSGIYSPLKIYSSIIKSYTETAAQAFDSIEKYGADGWDLGDTAKTGIESSVSGLYSMFDSLSLGLISEDTTGISAEDISNSLEKWAGGIGTDAGNYIKNHENLKEAYENSGVIGRIGITVYGVIGSWFD